MKFRHYLIELGNLKGIREHQELSEHLESLKQMGWQYQGLIEDKNKKDYFLYTQINQ